MLKQNSLVEELKQLKDLFDNRVIDETEFTRMKNEILKKKNIPSSNTPIPMANTTLSSGDQSGNFFLVFITIFLVFMVFFCLGFALF